MSPMIPKGKQHSRVNIDKSWWLGGLVIGGLGTMVMSGRGAVDT